MTFYEQSAATALSLITRFGQSLAIRRVSNVPNIATGEATPTNTDGTITAVVLPAKTTGLNALAGDLDNQALVEAVIKGKGRFLLVAASGAPFAPDADDRVTFESASWRVLGSTPLNPAGTPIVYKVGMIRA